MGNFDATIITGSLDSKELESSINRLVASVEEKTNSMAMSFENSIAKIKTSMASLNGMNIMSNDGAAKQTKRNIEETTIAYDKLAMAMQKAMQPKSAEQSFYTFIQQYREHAAQLARDIKNMPSQSLDRQMAEYQRFEVEISNVQRKIQELRTQLNDVARNPNATRFDVKAITDQIGIYENQIKQLTTEQIRSTRRIADEDNATMANKRALYEKTIQLVRELTSEQNNSTNAAKAQIDVQDQLTRKIQRQAEIIRQRMQESGSNSAIWGNAVIYKEGAGSKLSIEEQLLQAHQRQVSLTQERINAEQRENQIKKENVGVAQQQVQVEQQVTQTIQQRGSANNTTQKTFKTYEDFAQALAHVLGVQRNEIKLANEETASYEKLQATLRTLQSVYNKLSNSERNSDNGKALIASIHEVERAMQKIRSQSTRPINLQSVLNLPTKTLDDIAYKMRMLQNYRNGLDFTKQINEINQVNSAINDLQRKQNALMGTTRKWSAENNILGRSLDYIKNRLAFVFTVGASTAFVKSIYEIRGQYELLERSMGILVDSMQQGSQIFAELNAMAIKSPFTTMELGAAAKQLTAYDIAAKDVVDVTRRLADMAAAVGVPIERLTYALGQIKAYGYLNARDARMFANAGIPLVQELADRYTELEGRLVSVGDVYDRIKKKAISFDDVMDVVNNITNEDGRFFNFQEKAADTLKVKIANLTLAYNNMLNEIGKSHQAILTAPLVALKTLLEHWRDIDNALSALVYTFGAVKIAQIAYYVWWRKASLATATATATNLAFARTLTAIKASLAGMMTNPFGLAIAGLTIFGSMLAKTYLDYRDLQEANKAFNNSIVKNAEENINSIDKFFGEYKKQLDGIGGESVVIQQKMWERIKEEIEKTSKSARMYLDILDNIGNVSDRIQAGRAVLEQINEINKEAKNLAERGLFNVGGGFGDDSIAEKLKEQEEIINKMVVKYGSLKKAQEAAVSSPTEAGMGVSFSLWDKYQNNITETEKELEKFVSVLDKADIKEIMGEGTNSAQLANIREFASIIRDNFLATEKGQKISIQGRSVLNKYLDEWIAKQGKANKLIGDERAKIEANRSAWETFFEQLNEKDKQRLDYIVSTNQTKSKAFQEIWDKATKNMEKNAAQAYDQIQSQIAELRNTPDIVIKVIYRESKEELDAQQKQFEEDFLTPKGKGALAPDDYFKEQKRLREKYGRFQKKEGEDNVEWEKRLGETYRNNSGSLKKLNAQIAKSAEMSNVDKTAKIAERDALKEENKALDEIAKKQGFNYEKEKKGRKGSQRDKILDALKKEIELIKKAQSEYETLTKKGASSADALASAQSKFGKTISLLNNKLSHWGLPTIDLRNIIKGDPNKTLAFFEKVKKALETKGLSNVERMKAIEVVIDEFDIKAKSFNLDKITKGLNNELGKLKDEYELAVELDANPELGDIFADFLQIDKNKLAELPRSINQLMSKLQSRIDKVFADNKFDLKFNVSKLINKDKFDKWVEETGHKPDDDLVKSLNAVREYLNELLKNETKQLSELVSKYDEAHVKIEKIYAKSARSILSVISTYGGDEEKQKGLDLANQISISDDPATVTRLRNELKTLAESVADKSDAAQNLLDAIFKNEKESIAKALWEGFKGGNYYSIIFDDLSRASTAALQGMKAQLDGLKDQIKESPESMKAFMSAYSKLRTELIERDPFQGIADGLNNMRIAHQQVIIAMAELDAANRDVENKERALNELRKKEPNNIVKIYQAEKELAKAKKNVADKTTKVVKAQNDETESQEDYKKAIKASDVVIKKLADSLKEIGETLDNTTGNVIKFIGDILNFVTFVSDSMTTVSQNASRAIQTIEKASVILAIISAAIQLIQELNSLIPDSFDQYEKAAEKQAEINKLTDAIVQYQLAVLAARMEEENWFSESSLKKLKNFYSIGSKALDDYNNKLMESQAVYQNQQSGGWLTKFAYWTNPATWIQKLTGIEGKWADAIALVGSGLFGMEAQMGQLGIWLTQHVNKDVYDYEEGFTAAIANLRIETKARSKGFLGTGLGGHAQETEDLVEWVKRELGLDLFDKDFMLNEEAYKVLMDKYADKLVGETKATLEALHDLQEKWNEYIEQLQDYVDSLYSPLVDNMSDALWSWYDKGKNALTSFREYASDTFRSIVTDMMKTIILSKFAEEYANDIQKLYTNYAKGGISEEQLITAVADRTGQMMEDFNQSMPVLESLMNTAGEVLEKYGISLRKGSGAELSQLQQGIQSITESTAGAIEAYMNILNQRVFYHGTILEQIRDVVVTMNFDAQLGILAQMLLQLQNNYIVMQSMQSMMENWTIPSGQGIRVELLS